MADRNTTKPSFFDNFVRTIGGLATLRTDPSRLESVLTQRGRERASAEHAAALEALALQRQGFTVDREKLTQMQGVLEAAKNDPTGKLNSALQSTLALFEGNEAQRAGTERTRQITEQEERLFPQRQAAGDMGNQLLQEQLEAFIAERPHRLRGLKTSADVGEFSLGQAQDIEAFWRNAYGVPDSAAAQFEVQRTQQEFANQLAKLGLGAEVAGRQFPEMFQGPGGEKDVRTRPTAFQSGMEQLLAQFLGLPAGQASVTVPPGVDAQAVWDKVFAASGRQKPPSEDASPAPPERRLGREINQGVVKLLGSSPYQPSSILTALKELMQVSPYRQGGPSLTGNLPSSKTVGRAFLSAQPEQTPSLEEVLQMIQQLQFILTDAPPRP